MAGAGLAVPLAGAFGFLALLAPAVSVLVAAGLSFTTNWGPSDFPFRADGQPLTAEEVGPGMASGSPKRV
jgi:hypothetical protein